MGMVCQETGSFTDVTEVLDADVPIGSNVKRLYGRLCTS